MSSGGSSFGNSRGGCSFGNSRGSQVIERNYDWFAGSQVSTVSCYCKRSNNNSCSYYYLVGMMVQFW